MSAINGSKSKTNSSKSSTEGGPAPQRFDVAAMVVLCACYGGGGGWRTRARQMCRLVRGGSKCGFCASASRQRSLARWSRAAAGSECWLWVSAHGGGASAAVVPGG